MSDDEHGLPAAIERSVEEASGLPMDDVGVHRNSDAPAQLQTLAYPKAAEIHLGPGQEEHLPHEAWHVVQQEPGRVRTATKTDSAAVNDDDALERKADAMGARASRTPRQSEGSGVRHRETTS